MPNWKIHLEIGKRVNKKLRYRDAELELFLFGNILPDINNQYQVRDISQHYSHNFTHYSDEEIPGYLSFYQRYKNNFDNPIVYGYFVHLFTDYIWNNDFYSRYDDRDDLNGLDKDSLRILKQRDFKCYNNLFIDNKLSINNVDLVVDESTIIDRVSINKADINKISYFIDNYKNDLKNLEFYKKEQLDELMKKTVNKIISF